MSEYIKREDVENMLENAVIVHDGEHCGYCTEYVSIDKIPAANVVEVKHGKWEVRTVRGEAELYCSVCGNSPNVIYAYEFCPNCGAKMDLED